MSILYKETTMGNLPHSKHKDDVVNHPQHYTQGNIEVIDFILDQEMTYLEGNIIKYVSRHGYKNGLEDLKKAEWYLKRLMETDYVHN